MTQPGHKDLERFATEIVGRLGFGLHRHNEDDVGLAMQHALARTQSGSVAEYIARFTNDKFAKEELHEIAMELTVAETYFFRHSEHFQAMVEVAIPELITAKGDNHTLNVLSAGCATGEEAYSVAACLADVSALQGWNIRVCGIDVNSQLLDKARAGRYSPWSLRGVSDAQRRRHFTLDNGVYVLNAALKSAVRFEPHNLLEEDPQFWRANFFDIIFCRNVMIYFSPAAMRALAARLTRSLVPGGFLFLGPSETLRGISQDFHLRHTHGAFYYQRRRANEPAPPGVPYPATKHRIGQNEDVPAAQDAAWPSAIANASSRIASLADQSGRPAPSLPPASIAPQQAAPFLAQDLAGIRDFLRQERFDDALKAIGTLPRAIAADSDTLLLQAAILTSKGDLSHAQQVCGQLLAKDEMRPGAHYLMAVCQERRGDLLSAAEHDQMAMYLEPDFAMPHLHLGLVAKRMGDIATARRELGEAMVLLNKEDASRILMFGGGFTREALVRFCQAQLDSIPGADVAGKGRQRDGGSR